MTLPRMARSDASRLAVRPAPPAAALVDDEVGQPIAVYVLCQKKTARLATDGVVALTGARKAAGNAGKDADVVAKPIRHRHVEQRVAVHRQEHQGFGARLA